MLVIDFWRASSAIFCWIGRRQLGVDDNYRTLYWWTVGWTWFVVWFFHIFSIKLIPFSFFLSLATDGNWKEPGLMSTVDAWIPFFLRILLEWLFDKISSWTPICNNLFNNLCGRVSRYHRRNQDLRGNVRNSTVCILWILGGAAFTFVIRWNNTVVFY